MATLKASAQVEAAAPHGIEKSRGPRNTVDAPVCHSTMPNRISVAGITTLQSCAVCPTHANTGAQEAISVTAASASGFFRIL